MEADISTQAVGLASNTDFSIFQLFIRADFIVKSVIIILIACSVYSWAIIFEKFKLFKKINLSTQEFENKFWKSKSAESFYNNLPSKIDDPMAKVFINSMQVLLKSKRASNLEERMSRMLEISIEQQMEKIEKNYTFLATVGSTAPFIGLFGTVWGIMNSFRSLANMSQATLASVAPGISEALIATAMGLFAAIPAVIGYNRFSAKADSITDLYQTFSDELITILHRAAHSQTKE